MPRAPAGFGVRHTWSRTRAAADLRAWREEPTVVRTTHAHGRRSMGHASSVCLYDLTATVVHHRRGSERGDEVDSRSPRWRRDEEEATHTRGKGPRRSVRRTRRDSCALSRRIKESWNARSKKHAETGDSSCRSHNSATLFRRRRRFFPSPLRLRVCFFLRVSLRSYRFKRRFAQGLCNRQRGISIGDRGPR